MTSEDDSSLSEEELDEIAKRVAEQLGGSDEDEADDPGDEIEVHVEDDLDEEEPVDGDEADAESAGDTRDDEQDPRRKAERTHERARRKAERKRKEARKKAAEAQGLEDLGDRIEAAVESQLAHVGDHIEHALGEGLEPPEPPTPGVVIDPDDAREKAVYKTQLQKGGRVAVPDTEIEALGLNPGDTLQVVLYPVE